MTDLFELFRKTRAPASLWVSGIYRIPGELASVYSYVLRKIGREQDAANPSYKENNRLLYGGPGKDETHEHFTRRFMSSPPRMQCILLNIEGSFSVVQKDLLESLFDGNVALLDVPCGAGGGVCGLITTISELRKHRSLPSMPLNVHIMAADASGYAMELYADMLNGMRGEWRKNGICVDFMCSDWDVTKPNTTARLMDEWFDFCVGCDEYIVLIANFSGFGKSNFDEMQRSIGHITERLYNKKCTLLWVEPHDDTGKKMSRRVLELFGKIFWFVPGVATIPWADYQWMHPLTRILLRGNVSVLKYSKKENI